MMAVGAHSTNAPVVEVRNAWKAFGAVTAVEGVDLTIRRGEIVALLGDNGAGKSTLIKAISGVHRLDAGEILIDGERVSIRNPAEARALGIETVYQDLSLFENLGPVQNFFVGREATVPRWLGPLGLLRKKHMALEWDRLASDLQVRIKDSRRSIALMSGGQRQAVAVAKAIAFASRLLILDEPTAALGVRESRSVLDLIQRLPERGLGVILISHNLEEVMQVAHRAVVLRQGRFIGEATPEPANHELIVAMIVGARTQTEVDPASMSDDEEYIAGREEPR
jgi:ABC-type sugar transport system ATPase subunit